MIRSILMNLVLAGALAGQDPFVPLQLDPAAPVLDRRGAREEWVKTTNLRMELSRRTLRVALRDDGQTAVVLARGVTTPRHAKPILTGKGEYKQLLQSVSGLGFSRMVVRNPDTGQEWAARLERGRPVLER